MGRVHHDGQELEHLPERRLGEEHGRARKKRKEKSCPIWGRNCFPPIFLPSPLFPPSNVILRAAPHCIDTHAAHQLLQKPHFSVWSCVLLLTTCSVRYPRARPGSKEAASLRGEKNKNKRALKVTGLRRIFLPLPLECWTSRPQVLIRKGLGHNATRSFAGYNPRIYMITWSLGTPVAYIYTYSPHAQVTNIGARGRAALCPPCAEPDHRCQVERRAQPWW